MSSFVKNDISICNALTEACVAADLLSDQDNYSIFLHIDINTLYI